jgi:hypothetical protein
MYRFLRSNISGVEMTTRQLAKCEWNSELASNFLNLLASLSSVFFSSVQMLSKDMILASFSLIWRVKFWVTRQSGECLENLYVVQRAIAHGALLKRTLWKLHEQKLLRVTSSWTKWRHRTFITMRSMMTLNKLQHGWQVWLREVQEVVLLIIAAKLLQSI